MALLKRGRRSKRLVLDIGTSAIRLCELAPTKAGYQLVKYHQRELNIDPAMDEEDKAERRKEVLQELLKETKTRARKTILAVPGQSVFTRNRPLPPVPEFKVTQIVRYEIQQQIPFSLDQIALDYQVLDRTEAGGYDVMMAAIKVDVVEKQLEILRKVKRSIDVVDVAPIAAYNWLRHTGEFGEDGKCVGLIDLGATTADIIIQKDNQFKFTRSLHVGGNDITTAIASNFNMTFEEAERLKRDKGFAPTGDPKRDGRGGEVIGRVLNRLVAEINRSFAYFRSQPGGGPVQRVIITGGGACLRNIIPYLQRQLGIEVRIAQPLAGLAVGPKANEASEHPEQACVALGLALRCCQNVPIQINLIPPRVLEIARRKEQAFYWLLSLATMYLILASIIPVTAQKDKQVQDTIKQLESVLARYDASLINDPEQRSDFEDDFDQVKSNIDAQKQDLTRLDNLRKYRNFWLPYMQAINDSRPFTGLSLSGVEAIVIGGPGNTGVSAWRNKENGNKPAKKPAGGNEGGPSGLAGGGNPPPQAPAQGGGGLNIGAFQQLAAAGGGGGGGGGGGDVTGFPGVGPQKLVEPNGLSLVGYASDMNRINEFKENLEKSGVFIPKGVYLDEEFLDTAPESDLQDARTVKARSGSSASSRSTSSSTSGGGGLNFGALQSFAGSGGGGSRARRGPQAQAEVGAGEQIFQFHIDVQFIGRPIKMYNDKPKPGPRAGR